MLIYVAQNAITGLELDSNPLFANALFMTYLSTGMTSLFNTVIIPAMVTICVKFEDFDTRSETQIAILNRNYFFLLVNTLFLPITGAATIEAFVEIFNASGTKIKDWPSLLAGNMLSTYDYFMTFFVQIAFITIGS